VCAADAPNSIAKKLPNNSLKAFDQQMNYRQFHHRLRLSGVDFVVAIQSPGEGKPSKGALDDLARGQNHEFAGLVALGDLDGPTEHHSRPVSGFSGVASVSKILSGCRESDGTGSARREHPYDPGSTPNGRSLQE